MPQEQDARQELLVMRAAILLLVFTSTAAAADLPAGAVRRIGDGRFLHIESVRAIAPSPDGRTIATIEDDAVYLWDAATGSLRFRTECEADLEDRFVWVGWVGEKLRTVVVRRANLRGLRAVDYDPATGRVTRRGPVAPARPPQWVAIAPDGDKVVVLVRPGNDRPTALLLHDLTGARLPIGLTESAATPTAEFAPDGKSLAVADGSPTVRVIDASTGKPLRELKLDADGARVGPFTPDGTGLVVFTRQGEKWTTAIRDAAAGTVRTVLPTDADARFVQVRFAPDGKRAALKEHQAAWELIDLATRKVICHAPDDTDVQAFAPDGRTFYAARDDGRPYFIPCDATTGKPRLAPDGPVQRVRFRDDGKLLGMAGGRVIVWDPATGAERARSTPLPDVSESYTAFGSFSPDGTRYAYLAGTNIQRVHMYDLTAGLIRTTYDTDVRIPYPRFTASGVLVLPHPGRLGVYDGASGTEVASVRLAHSGYRGIDTSADGRRLVVGAPEGAVVVGLPGGEPVVRLPWPGGGNGVAAAISPDGRTAFTAAGGLVAAWDVGTGRRRWEKPLAGREARWANVLPDGRSLAVATPDGAVLLLEAATGAVRVTFVSAGHALLSFGMSPDGRYVATACPDGPSVPVGCPRRGRPGRSAAGRRHARQALGRPRGADATVAYRAMQALARHPDRAVPFLAGQVSPVAAVDSARVAKLIAELDSPAFAIREAADRSLRKIGELAGPALEAALADSTSAEVRERARAMLLAVPKPTAQDVRSLRAAEVLEWAGTPAAKAVLAKLAGGAEGASLTRDARAAVGRMK